MLLGTTLLLLACTPHPTQETHLQEPDARQVFWQRSLEDALALARAQQRPILVAVNMDGESASDRIVHEEYRDPAFVAATRECVCLVASVFRHSPRDHDDEGRRIPCPRLGELTCGEHMALEPLLFERFLADGERVAPRHALILPGGAKAFDLSLCFDLRDIDRALFAAVGAGAPARPSAGAGDEAPPSGDESWSALAARRDNRGRARLETALWRVPDESTLGAALDAIAALGDAGSLDALCLVGARLPHLSQDGRARFVACARALDLALPLALELRQALTAPTAVPEDLYPAQRATLLPVLAELDGDSPATRSLLCACRALEEYGDDSARALRIALGAAAAAAVEKRVSAQGGALSLSDVLRTAEAVTRSAGESALPASGTIGDAMPEAEALERELEALVVELRTRADDAQLEARFAKASLDLARRRIESQGSGIPLLLEDAEHNFALALERDAERAVWWLERARTAYFRQRFEQQVEYGRRALALLGEPAEDPLAVEALRWIGDGDARLLAQRSGKDPALELAGILEGLRALGAVAASRYGDATDWSSFASFLGALGLRREELALALRGAERLPAAAELRQLLNGALWSTGRIELAPALAEEIASRNAPSADALWHAGYAWILAAEDLRRREACEPAIKNCERARARFEAAAERNPDYSATCQHYVAMTWLGGGLAHVRLGRRELAADCLVAAAATRVELEDKRDGIGYDVLDLVDKILEWRDSGPSPLDPLELLDRLELAAPRNPFWATAISDSELREALRADGRNPERAERDSVDAAGEPMRQVMGLPWEQGDAYLEASIVAGRRALIVARRGAPALASSEAVWKPLAQSCTIRAERQLELGRLQGVQAALAEAAALFGFDAPPPDADEPSLRELAGRLRIVLGEARPHLRPGR